MPKPKKLTNLQRDIQQECITIVDRERTNWEEAVTFITPKVAFRMRELIRILRKNYWGVYDNPIDKNTQREKFWINLVMSTVETWVKNIDLDTKDIGFIARNENGYDITELTRLVVKDYLDKMDFGETLDADERQVLIDGTVVWKTWEDSSTGKVVMKRKTIDLLNFYIDPTEENVQTAYRATERGIVTASSLRGMTGWMNTTSDTGGDLPGSQILSKIDGSRYTNFGTRTTGEFRDVWECWGKIPKWLVDGDKKAEDAFDEIDGHIVISGLEAPEPKLHLVEENKRKDKFGNTIKPYEEWRCTKISGRWYGLGPVERILALQEYLNTIVNIRVNRHYISQLGLFKIKKGKGITPQMLSRLAANGAIQVQDNDDLTPMDMPEEDGSSYKDEEVIKYWAQQISSAMPITNGDSLPASTTATASAISSSSAKTSYTLFKEGMGMFITRWLDRGALPIIAKTIKIGDVIRLTKEDDSFKDIVSNIALNNVAEHLDKSDVVPSEQELLNELDKETERLLKKPALFFKNVQEIIASDIDTRVHVTNEDLDSQSTVGNIIQLIQLAPEYRDGMIRQVYDILGLSMPKKAEPQPQPQQSVGQSQPSPQQMQPPSPVPTQ